MEGRDAGTGETAPREPEATHAPPEQAQEAKTGEGQESTQKPWTPEERAAAIEAERQRQEQAKTGWSSEAEREEAIRQARERREADEREQERGSNDNDRGREME